MNPRKALRRTSYKVLPPAWRRMLLRRYHRLHGRTIVNILHISKTGGTAVKDAVRNHTVTETHALLLHSHEIRLQNIPTGEAVVFFLRDPVARFVSAFRFRQRQGQPRYDSPWTAAEVAIFQRFHSPGELARTLSDDDSERRREAEHAMRNIERLRRPQSDWIGSLSYLESRMGDILLIGFQESLAADFERLKAAVHLPAGLLLPDDPVRANRTTSLGDDKLDAVALRNIRSWYACDYELIETCRELTQDIRHRFAGQTATPMP